MVGSDPPAEGGMGVHMPPLHDADRGIPNRGVAPDTGHKLRIGIATPATVPQLQGSQRHTEALARTWNRQFRAHAHRCLMCTPRSAPTHADLVQFGRDPRQARVLKHGVMREEAPHEQFLTSGRWVGNVLGTSAR